MNEIRVPHMLGLKEAAETFGLSYNFLRINALKGNIPAVRTGRGKIFVNADGITDYLNHAKLTDEEMPKSESCIRPLWV